MDKILSIQTIKNVFAALGAKTSDDNYGVALLDKTTAEPKGLMGISDLALVLGVQIEEFSNSSHYGYSFPTSDGFAIKLAIDSDSFVLFCFGNAGKFYYKYIWKGESGSDWKLISTT